MALFDFDLDFELVGNDLSQLKHATATLWRYVVSHQVLEIRVEHEKGSATHLILRGCRQISAPANWVVSDLQASRGGEIESLLLMDQRAEVRITAKALELVTQVGTRDSTLK